MPASHQTDSEKIFDSVAVLAEDVVYVDAPESQAALGPLTFCTR